MNRGVITISESGTVSMPTDTVWMQSVIGRQTSRTKLVCIFTENAMA